MTNVRSWPGMRNNYGEDHGDKFLISTEEADPLQWIPLCYSATFLQCPRTNKRKTFSGENLLSGLPGFC